MIDKLSANQNRREIISLRSASMLAALILLGQIAVVLFLGDNPDLRIAISDLTYPLVNLLATFCLIHAARRSNGEQVRLAWMMLALAELCFTIGDVIWAIFEVGLNQSPFPSLADGPYLAFYPLFALGILFLPALPLTSTERLKVMLDTGIVMTASIILFWALLIAPTIASNTQGEALTATLAVAYPVMDLVLLFALIELLFRRLKSTAIMPLLLLIAGTSLMIVTDALYMSQSLQQTYVSGEFLDIGWFVFYILA